MLVSRIHRILLPIHCVFCGTRCKGQEQRICAGCLQDLPWCEQLQGKDVPPLSVVAAPLQYAFPVDAALKRFKFHRRLEYGPAFAELFLRVLPQVADDIDALLPMPLHWRRQAMRGYNQAHELALAVRRRTGLPILQSVRRVRATPFQSGLDAAARRQNLRAAFMAKASIEFRHVLIIDDVITTGESCRQLAKTVLDAGADKVSALAVARTSDAT
jgi:ComF family protein